MIRDDKIDILVDCTGICQGIASGFCPRAAPIQISGIGYPNTTGLQSMDYRISDDITDPPDEKSCYTENCFAYLMGSAVMSQFQIFLKLANYLVKIQDL